MKRIITILTIALITVGGYSQKLGHLNSQAVMLDMPDYESARKELESYKSELAKELEMFQKLIVEFAQDYEKIKAEMTPEARQRKEADLMERQQNYEKKAYEADRISAFGGVVLFNRKIDIIIAKLLSNLNINERCKQS